MRRKGRRVLTRAAAADRLRERLRVLPVGGRLFLD